MRPKTALILTLALTLGGIAFAQDQPNILVVWGDDIGQSNISAYTRGMMGYETPNIDRIANEGVIFTDYYGEQSCTAGRSSFITGQSVFRTGLSKVSNNFGLRIAFSACAPNAPSSTPSPFRSEPTAKTCRSISSPITAKVYILHMKPGSRPPLE